MLERAVIPVINYDLFGFISEGYGTAIIENGKILDDMAATTESHLDHTKPDERNGLPGAMPRKINVVMMGAGSGFTNSVLRDVVLIPDNLGGELRLCDIDPVRLALQLKLMQKVVDSVGQSDKWVLKSSTDRREVLPGADYVVNSIEVSGIDCVRFDNDIPLEFGVSQNIGDTIGPGGLMKAMRTVPVYIDILRDMRELCPKARMLNYTNPMNMMILAGSRAVPEIQQIGLCHSVQGTSRMLAGFADVPYEQVQWQCAGINHLAWFTEFNGPDGKSLYPILMAMAADRTSRIRHQGTGPIRHDAPLRCVHHRIERTPQRISSLLSQAKRLARQVHRHRLPR